MNELALFAGAGGGILGGHLLGWRCVCAVEYDKYARNVLLSRQRDGHLPRFPIWDDVRTFDGNPWRGVVDVVSGGFPCQDISSAGKGAGIEGARSGLWKEMARIIGEVRPQFAFVENSPLLIRRGLTTVLSDLAEMGYDAVWGIVSASQCGAPHERKRIWILANADSIRLEKLRTNARQQKKPQSFNSDTLADTASQRCRETRQYSEQSTEWIAGSRETLADTSNTDEQTSKSASRSKKRPQKQFRGSRGDRRWIEWWDVEPDLGRVANGVAARVDRLRCIGNGQVPIVAATAWRELMTLKEVV